jgi:hypothetical protein
MTESQYRDLNTTNIPVGMTPIELLAVRLVKRRRSASGRAREARANQAIITASIESEARQLIERIRWLQKRGSLNTRAGATPSVRSSLECAVIFARDAVERIDRIVARGSLLQEADALQHSIE